jgi:hypothetical protein
MPPLGLSLHYARTFNTQRTTLKKILMVLTICISMNEIASSSNAYLCQVSASLKNCWIFVSLEKILDVIYGFMWQRAWSTGKGINVLL